jgi:hypothetical protein
MASRDREAKLRKLFRDITASNRKIKSVSDAKLFFESVAVHGIPATCVELIVTSKAGLEAVRAATRSDLNPTFLKEQVLSFVVFLSDESVKALANGQFLRQILKTIVDPPTVWNALLDLLKSRALDPGSLKTLSWLTLELLEVDQDFAIDIYKDAELILAEAGLLHAEQHELRELGYRIEKRLNTRKKASIVDEGLMSTAGGRHDNDFADFRKIAIYPTTDEVLSTATPFYRTADDVFGCSVDSRASIHLDNQFRLLREDMLAELRDDLRIASGKKKGRVSASKFSGLTPIGLEHGNDKRSRKCSIVVECAVGLEVLHKISPGKRKKYLQENRNLLKHQAFGALCVEATVVAFAFIDRDIDLLVRSLPAISLVFADAQALKRALRAFKLSDKVFFMLVDTPVFAYEPVLRGLKSLDGLPFPEALLNPEAADLTYQPQIAICAFAIELKSLIPTSKGTVHVERYDVDLEESQRDSVVNALQNTVSLIQGPPGRQALIS